MESNLDVPSPILWLAEECRQQHGRLLIVGGGVRDHLLGKNPNDWDVEVFGVDSQWLQATLNRKGAAHKVGKSFGVFKWTVQGETTDVALPQQSNQSDLMADPSLTPKEAAKRRDLTINAIGFDPLAHEFIDPYDGQKHLRENTLHPVDKTTFLEDPLRVLRAAQFAARLLFRPSEFLIECGTEANLTGVPTERIRGEFIKLLCDGVKPSLGFHLLFKTNQYEALFPNVPAPTEQDLSKLDQLAKSEVLASDSKAHRLAMMLALWTLEFPIEAASDILTVLDIHSLERLDIRKHVLGVHRLHSQLEESDTSLRNLSTTVNLDILTSVVGIHRKDPKWASQLKQRAASLNILHQAPEPILKGRHLKDLGCSPGPQMAPIISDAYQKQLDGKLTTVDEAIQFARERLTRSE